MHQLGSGTEGDMAINSLSALQSVHHSGPDCGLHTHLLHLPGIITKVQLDVS